MIYLKAASKIVKAHLRTGELIGIEKHQLFVRYEIVRTMEGWAAVHDVEKYLRAFGRVDIQVYQDHYVVNFSGPSNDNKRLV